MTSEFPPPSHISSEDSDDILTSQSASIDGSQFALQRSHDHNRASKICLHYIDHEGILPCGCDHSGLYPEETWFKISFGSMLHIHSVWRCHPRIGTRSTKLKHHSPEMRSSTPSERYQDSAHCKTLRRHLDKITCLRINRLRHRLLSRRRHGHLPPHGRDTQSCRKPPFRLVGSKSHLCLQPR